MSVFCEKHDRASIGQRVNQGQYGEPERDCRIGQAEIGNSGKAATAYLTLGTAIAVALVAMSPRHMCAIETRAENICSLRAFLILTPTGHGACVSEESWQHAKNTGLGPTGECRITCRFDCFTDRKGACNVAS